VRVDVGVAKERELLRIRHVAIRIDAGALHLPIPDVAIDVVGQERRVEHERETKDDRAGDDDRERTTILLRQIARDEAREHPCRRLHGEDDVEGLEAERVMERRPHDRARDHDARHHRETRPTHA
jgi:hypothetical protein